MKKIFLSLLIILSIHHLCAENVTEYAKMALLAYSDANYPEAIEQYQEALKHTNEPTAELYYNLGCAYYKNGNLAEAILSFERAYRINPSDKDIYFNLSLASSQIVDKMEPANQFFLTRGIDNASHWFSMTVWKIIAIATFLLFVIGMLCFLRGKRVKVQKAGLITSLSGLLFFLISFTLLHRLHHFVNDQHEAILMSEVVTVKSSPDNSATDIVVVHSGLNVVKQQVLGGFAEVKLPDGTVGWIPCKSFELINNFSEK